MKKILIIISMLLSLICFANSERILEEKSGKIIMNLTTTINGQSSFSKQTMLFRDYGKKLFTRTVGKQSFGGNDINIDTTIVFKEDESFALDNLTKTYTIFDTEDDNYENQIERIGTGKLIGKEKILDKMCEIRETIDEDFTITQWIWKGIPLKLISTSHSGIKTESIATKIDLRNISNEEFEIPDNYTEATMDFGFSEEGLDLENFDLDALKNSFSEEDMKKAEEMMGDFKSLFE